MISSHKLWSVSRWAAGLALAAATPCFAAPSIGAGSLRLEAVACPDDADPAPGYQVAVELWMRDLSSPAQGFQAFLGFDEGTLTYRGDLSSYTNTPFPLHIQPILSALVAPGEIRVDGSDALGGPGSAADALLATLIFDVEIDCATTTVDFDLGQPFGSELSFDGDPLVTLLVNTAPLKLDDTPPGVVEPDDIETDADFGVCDALVTVPPLVTGDNCGVVASIVNSYNGTSNATDTYPSGTTVVNWTVTDDCGNTTFVDQDITVLPFNTLVLGVTLEGITEPLLFRCITLELWSCPDTAPVVIEGLTLPFVGGTFTGSINVPCGFYTCVTARDELHSIQRTLDESGDFINVPPFYIANFNVPGKTLLGGNANDDPYVDILDFGTLAGEYGTNYGSGHTDCDDVPPHADFSGDGVAFDEDYFDHIEPNFLELSDPQCCGIPYVEPPRPDGPVIFRLEHDPITDPIIIGESIDVNLVLMNIGANEIAGWQAFIEYDVTEIMFVQANYDLTNFDLVILDPVLTAPGTVDAAAGIDFINGTLPVSADGRVITFKFLVLDDSFCQPDVRFRDHFPKTRLSDMFGQQIPITLEEPPYGPSCQGDTNDDGFVDVNDLNNVILAWGTDDCDADIVGQFPGSPPDGIVDVNDLNAVIINWGPCP